VVIYSLSLVLLKVFDLEVLLFPKHNMTLMLMQLVNVIGYCVCYALVCVFYLAAFYSAMMQHRLIIKGVDILDTLRSVSTSRLSSFICVERSLCGCLRSGICTRTSVWISLFNVPLMIVVVFCIKILGATAFVVVFFVQDVRNHNHESSERLTRAVSASFIGDSTSQ
jgi:hypothetical protein